MDQRYAHADSKALRLGFRHRLREFACPSLCPRADLALSQLHSQISAALQAVRLISPSPIVLQVAGVFLPFVSRLEIHQPYLIRFDAVNRMIEEMSSDPASDFGEFVRMQSSLPECRGMSLGSYLLKPIQRLMKYPLFFKVGDLSFRARESSLTLQSYSNSPNSPHPPIPTISTRSTSSTRPIPSFV